MKIDPNDPRITAFALGELKGVDAVEIARAVRTDARVRAAVDEVRETAGLLMETLGGGECHMLTAEQRETIRKAGASPVITDIASARVPFWKRPAVAGIGAAAAVAISVYYIGGRPGTGTRGGIEAPEKWDWAQVEMDSLTRPADSGNPTASGASGAGGGGTVHAVSTAMRDDTASFRRELAGRIGKLDAAELESAAKLPELSGSHSQPWQPVVAGTSLHVPLASGATSWPWVKRCILEEKKLPPRRAVRIEEMVNHFRYKKPGMARAHGVAADLELCDAPWNPHTTLLAVHVSADGGQETDAQPGVTLLPNPERVNRIRLLGYARLKTSGGTDAPRPSQLSKSQGNYLLYELETTGAPAADGAIATLRLGEGDAQVLLPAGEKKSWIHASADLRFASVVSACGMLMHARQGVGDLDTRGLLSLVELIGKQDTTMLGGDRREALQIFRQCAALIDASGEKQPSR
ncbi:MAG: hypothetical protein CSA84_07575 [Actinomycetales bacterium]|nr:MAG: hypothetical protein CSA84_07575 [Actinomycetales bacterium]